VVAFASRGLERWLYPLGGGSVDWPAILDLLDRQADVAHRYTIELHRAFFDMPIFDPVWLSAQPDLTPTELASVVQLAQASRGVTDWQAYQDAPDTRLAPTLAYLHAPANTN
jgi:hypothetical protein